MVRYVAVAVTVVAGLVCATPSQAQGKRKMRTPTATTPVCFKSGTNLDPTPSRYRDNQLRRYYPNEVGPLKEDPPPGSGSPLGCNPGVWRKVEIRSTASNAAGLSNFGMRQWRNTTNKYYAWDDTKNDWDEPFIKTDNVPDGGSPYNGYWEGLVGNPACIIRIGDSPGLKTGNPPVGPPGTTKIRDETTFTDWAIWLAPNGNEYDISGPGTWNRVWEVENHDSGPWAVNVND